MKYISYNDKDKVFYYRDKHKNKTELTEIKGTLLGFSKSSYDGEYGLTDFFCIHLKGEDEYQIQLTYTYTTLFLMNKLLTCKEGEYEFVNYKDDILLKVNNEYPKAKYKWTELKFGEGWNKSQKGEHKDKIISKWIEILTDRTPYVKPTSEPVPEDRTNVKEDYDDIPF